MIGCLRTCARMGAQWLSGRVLDSRPRGRGFEPHRRHCVVSLSKNINPSLVLVQPRKTRPFITKRLLMGRKESNQTNKQTKQTCARLQQIIALDFKLETVLKFYNPEVSVNLGLATRKPVFGIFELVRLSSACSHTNTTVKLLHTHSK